MVIRPGLHRIDGTREAAAFLAVEEDGLTLIDTGLWGSLPAIRRAALAVGRRPEDIRRVLITHHHPDHIGELVELQQQYRVETYVHRQEAPFIRGERPQTGLFEAYALGALFRPLKRFFRTRPAAVDHELEDGDELPFCGGIRVLHTPGHTPGSVCYWFRSWGALLVGDVLNHRRSTMAFPLVMFSSDPAQAARTPVKLAPLQYEAVGFGHGPVILEGGDDRVRRFLAERRLLPRREEEGS